MSRPPVAWLIEARRTQRGHDEMNGERGAFQPYLQKQFAINPLIHFRNP